MGFFRRKTGPHGEEQTISGSARVAITKAQRAGADAIFHGACSACLWRKGNAQGEGLKWCMGCAFFNFTDHLPNRRLSEATDGDFAADEACYYD
jgi:hypothetical protein